MLLQTVQESPNDVIEPPLDTYSKQVTSVHGKSAVRLEAALIPDCLRRDASGLLSSVRNFCRITTTAKCLGGTRLFKACNAPEKSARNELPLRDGEECNERQDQL